MLRLAKLCFGFGFDIAGEPPTKKPRKKKEPELGPDGQPLPKPKKPRKKKPADGAAPGGDKATSSASGTHFTGLHLVSAT